MPHYNIVIETHRDRDPDRIRATVAKGPPLLLAYGQSMAADAETVYSSLCRIIREDWPEHTFDFIHAEG